MAMIKMLLIFLVFFLFILSNIILTNGIKKQTGKLINDIKNSFLLKVIVFLKLFSKIKKLFKK